MLFDRRFRAKRNGSVEINITDEERRLIADLVEQLRELVLSTSPEGSVDDSIRRLYPTAYVDDPEHEHEYQRLMRDQLLERRLGHLDVVEATLQDRELSSESLTAWITSINDVRLVLGTHLDVSEDEEPTFAASNDPDQQQRAIYQYLSHLLGELLDVAGN
ncbi:MAG: DUF2017 family protein [Acidimicrobiales bacterium]|nr:DUF2017 family protein [Acidimicrobiales bacterium]